jgi:hypothetical protein
MVELGDGGRRNKIRTSSSTLLNLVGEVLEERLADCDLLVFEDSHEELCLEGMHCQLFAALIHTYRSCEKEMRNPGFEFTRASLSAVQLTILSVVVVDVDVCVEDV